MELDYVIRCYFPDCSEDWYPITILRRQEKQYFVITPQDEYDTLENDEKFEIDFVEIDFDSNGELRLKYVDDDKYCFLYDSYAYGDYEDDVEYKYEDINIDNFAEASLIKVANSWYELFVVRDSYGEQEYIVYDTVIHHGKKIILALPVVLKEDGYVIDAEKSDTDISTYVHIIEVVGYEYENSDPEFTKEWNLVTEEYDDEELDNYITKKLEALIPFI